MYSVCRSVIGLSCVDVIQSFTYVLRVIILTSLNDVVRERERERQKASGDTNGLSQIPSKKEKKKEEIKSGTSGCGSFVVPYLQPATSTTDHLQYYWVFVKRLPRGLKR